LHPKGNKQAVEAIINVFQAKGSHFGVEYFESLLTGISMHDPILLPQNFKFAQMYILGPTKPQMESKRREEVAVPGSRTSTETLKKQLRPQGQNIHCSKGHNHAKVQTDSGALSVRKSFV
jgi:hypothetical protein